MNSLTIMDFAVWFFKLKISQTIQYFKPFFMWNFITEFSDGCLQLNFNLSYTVVTWDTLCT